MKYTFDGVELGLVSGTTEICDSVPLGTYTFEYSKITGLHVVRTSDIPEVDFMVFGKINYRVEKTFSAYKRRNPKNTGVLLSGEPGMGKSLFVRIMSGKALSNGIPVFVVKENLPGVVDFISELKCPALIVLDEFEKTFSQSEHESDNDDGSNSSQDKFLSVMDGVGGVSSKLFVAAVNEVDKVSRFMLNRPGRFLYHFEFNSLGNDEICEVCDSKLVKIGLKNELLMRLVGHSINYDSLFAIIDELNSGADIDETLDDMNLNRHGSNVFMKCTLRTNLGFIEEHTMIDDLGDKSTTHHVDFDIGGKIKVGEVRFVRVRFKDEDITAVRDGRLCVDNEKLQFITYNDSWDFVKTDAFSFGDLFMEPQSVKSVFNSFSMIDV